MRSTFLLILLAISAQAAEPLQALAPPALVAYPGAADAPVRSTPTLDVGKFLFVAVRDYAGEVTFDVNGDVVAWLAVKPGQQYPGIKQGTTEPAFYAAPDSKCDVIMVLGRTPGDCVITAWGVKTEADATKRESSRAVKLASFTIAVGAQPMPKPDPKPDPKPKPEPYVGKWRILVVEETATAANNRGQFFTDEALMSFIRAKCSHRPRIVDQDVKDANGQSPADIAPWLSLAKGKALPQVFIVGGDGTVLLSGDLPKTPADFLKTLKGVAGE
jgi:hypothetical protein